MMKCRKALCFLFVVLLTLSTLAVPLGAIDRSAEQLPFKASIRNSEGHPSVTFAAGGQRKTNAKPNDILAAQVVFTADVTDLYVNVSAYGTKSGEASIALYRFHDSYDLSLLRSPVAEYTFRDIPDRATLTLSFGSRPLPKGEYVIVLYNMVNPSGNMGAWTHNTAFDGQLCYINGEWEQNMAIHVAADYKTAPAKAYGKPTLPAGAGEIDYAPLMSALIDFREESRGQALIGGTNLLTTTFHKEDGGFFRFQAADNANDPYAFIDFPATMIKCNRYPYLLIKLRRSAGSPLGGQYFFTTDETGLQEAASLRPAYTDSTDWQYVLLDLGHNSLYTGLLKSLRFDIFLSCEGVKGAYIDFQYAALFQSREAALAFHDNFEDFAQPDRPVEPDTDKPDYSTYMGADAPKSPVAGHLTENGQLGYLYKNYPYTMDFTVSAEEYMAGKSFGFAQIDNALVVDEQLRCRGYGSYTFFTKKFLGDRFGLRGSKLAADLLLESGAVSFTLRQIFPNDDFDLSGIRFTILPDGLITVEERDGFRETVQTGVDFTKEHRVAAFDDGRSVGLEVDGKRVVTVLTDTVNRTIRLAGSDKSHPAIHLPGAGYAAFTANRSRGFVDNVSYDYIDIVPKDPSLQQALDFSTWTAIDDLGRVVPAGAPTNDKKVGLFYFLIHSEDMGSRYVNDVTRMYLESGFSALDQKLASMAGRNGCYWAEPYFGYYSSHDTWIYRKHAEMLNAAGVDFIFLDVSNDHFFLDQVLTLLDTWKSIRDAGGQTPEVCFMFGDRPTTLVNGLYTLLEPVFNQVKYDELLFKWDKHPLLLGNDDTPDKRRPHGWTVSSTTPQTRDQFRAYIDARPDLKRFYEERYEKLLKARFTVRKCWAWQANRHPGYWDWLQETPQAPGLSFDKVPEQMSVSMGVHAHTNRGRSYVDGNDKYNPDGEFGFKLGTAKYGYHFAEQCEYALKQDVSVLMITGWNEWYAGIQMGGGQSGQTTTSGYYFVDQMSPEYSRDGEPMRIRDGVGFGDNYYYQMAAYIRKFKGVGALPAAVNGGTMDLNAADPDEQWEKVGPGFTDTVGDCTFRSENSFTSEFLYVNGTARNDLATAKVSQDADSLFFHITTATPLITVDDELWMNLYLDADNNPETGWEGYDYILNRSRTDKTVSVEKFVDGTWSFEKVGDADYVTGTSSLTIRVDKTAVGGTPGTAMSFHFKWADNAAVDGDIMKFMDCGDTAPDDRFMFAYVSDSIEDQREDDETGDTSGETVLPDIPDTQNPIPETTVPEAPGSETTVPETEAPKKKGCRSAFGTGSTMAAVLSVLSLSAAALTRRTGGKSTRRRRSDE